MRKRHFNGLGFKRDGRDDSKKEKGGDKEGNKDDDGFPAVHDCYMIYGGPSRQLTTRQRKRERREVFAARMAVPQYLSWSSTPISFDREDHPDKVVALGVYPLVVDPIIVAEPPKCLGPPTPVIVLRTSDGDAGSPPTLEVR